MAQAGAFTISALGQSCLATVAQLALSGLRWGLGLLKSGAVVVCAKVSAALIICK